VVGLCLRSQIQKGMEDCITVFGVNPEDEVGKGVVGAYLLPYRSGKKERKSNL